jgi:uncharacterized protein (DUF1786 family)
VIPTSQILAIDIGAGTQDILLYQALREEENNPILVLPTPSGVWAKRLEGIAADLFIHGDTIGGGRIGSALRRHMDKGYRVAMTAEAARSIRDDLDQVRQIGIEVVKDRPAGFIGEVLEFQEANIIFVQDIFRTAGTGEGIAVIALAVQDHGAAPPGESDRAFRFSCFQRILQQGRGFAGFVYLQDEIPSYYYRMRSAAQRATKGSAATVMLMDTALSAILGVKEDEGTQVALNIGNGHTIMALVINGELQGLFEHHTSQLTPAKLRDYILRFPRGEVNHEEIFAEGGHGVFALTKANSAPITITVTGPKRGIMRETGLSYALPAPGGSMMMTGPWGLVKAARMRGLL